MRKRFSAICLVSVVLIALIAVLVPSCGGGGGGQCTINVKATLDGSTWSGAVNYTLTPVSGSVFTGTNVSASFTVACGNWTCAYVSGGPAGANLESITPSATQSMTSGTITFTLNFKTIPPEEKCTIDVKATLCDIPWQGAVQYTLTGSMPPPLSGTSVLASFTVDCGNWTCAYVSGGPAGAFLKSITPSATQGVSGGGTITFTLNFELNQDAWIKFLPLTWTINGTAVQPGTQEAVACQIIDAHYLQGVDGCVGYNVTINEISWLNIVQAPGQVPPAMIYVVDDPSAVTKTPTPLQKLSQVPSANNVTVQNGESFNLTIGQPTLLDAHTVWQLVKGTNYTKTINWLGISVLSQYWEPHPGVLFELVLPGPGQYAFTLQTSAMVALVGDVNSQNDSTGWSPQLNLMIMVPQ